MLDLLLALDTKLFLLLNASFANPLFDLIFPVITNPHFWILPALAASAIFLRAEKRKAVLVLLLLLLTIALADPIGARIIKPWVGRLRPCHPDVLIDGGRFLIGYKRSFSFPSNHAMNMFAAAALLFMFYPRRFVWFFGFAVLIGYSRIYTGVHYPFDVLGGAAFGIIVAGMIYYSYEGYLRWSKRLARNREKGADTNNSMQTSSQDSSLAIEVSKTPKIDSTQHIDGT